MWTRPSRSRPRRSSSILRRSRRECSRGLCYQRRASIYFIVDLQASLKHNLHKGPAYAICTEAQPQASRSQCIPESFHNAKTIQNVLSQVWTSSSTPGMPHVEDPWTHGNSRWSWTWMATNATAKVVKHESRESIVIPSSRLAQRLFQWISSSQSSGHTSMEYRRVQYTFNTTSRTPRLSGTSAGFVNTSCPGSRSSEYNQLQGWHHAGWGRGRRTYLGTLSIRQERPPNLFDWLRWDGEAWTCTHTHSSWNPYLFAYRSESPRTWADQLRGMGPNQGALPREQPPCSPYWLR